MADFSTWLQGLAQTLKLGLTQTGLVLLSTGAASAYLINSGSEKPPELLFVHPVFTPVAVTGGCLFLIGLWNDFMRPRLKRAAKRREGRQHRQKISLIAQNNLAGLRMEEVQGLVLLLKQPHRRFCMQQNFLLRELTSKHVIQDAHMEDGVFSKDTYLIEESIWLQRDEIIEAFRNVKEPSGNPFGMRSPF